MKKLILLLLLASPAFGQLSSTGNITISGATCAVTNACVALNLYNSVNVSTSTATITLSGTFTGTFQFEASGDNGTTFVSLNCTPVAGGGSVTSTTAAGTWTCSIAALTQMRVRASAAVTGTAVTTIQASAPAIGTIINNYNGTGAGTTAEQFGAATTATPATNTAAIQTALNRGGYVTLLTPGTFQVSSSLIINSNTYFKLGAATRLQLSAGTSTNILINNGYNTFTTTASVSLAWSSGTTVTATWTAHGLSVGQWVVIAGANQSYYNGVFQVQSVADANTFTYQTYRTPATAATGTIVGQVADMNITVDGGIWDQNYPTVPLTPGSRVGDSIILSSLAGGSLKNIVCVNSMYHCISMAAMANFVVDTVAYTEPTTQPTNLPGDLVKAYGPEYNVKLTNLYGTTWDDGASFQTKEAAAFPTAQWTFGDIINCGFDHVNLNQTPTANATGLVVFYSSPNEYMGGVYARNIMGAAKANGVVLSASYDNAVIDDVELDNVNVNAASGVKLVQTVGSTAFTINSLTIKNSNFYPTSSAAQFINTGATVVVGKLGLENLNVTQNSALVSGAYVIDIGGTVNNLWVKGGNIQGSNPRFIKEETTATISVISVDGITTSGADQLFNLGGAAVSVPQINITNSDINNTTTVLNLSGSANVFLANNKITLSSGANGVIRTTGTITVHYAAFGNNLTQGVYQATASGTPVLTSTVCDLAGNCTQSNSQVVGGTATTFGSSLTYASSPCETTYGITTLATGAATTDTGLNCLPANSIIDAVIGRVTTTITAACTGWSLGDATTAARFASNNTTLTSGTTTDAAHIGTFNNSGIASATTGIWQAAAAKVRITCAGGNPGAGAIRVIVFYHTWATPTS